MATGGAWNVEDPTKPWALWDPDANIKIPVYLDDWIAELSTGYGSHTIITAAPLEVADAGTYASGVIAVRMKLVTSPTYTPGTKYPFTIRLTGADAVTKDDRTLYLKVKDR